MEHTFQAEIKQLLNILVHSLYKDRDIFLRELVSNASDALNRVQFEMLTNPDVLDPEGELAITVTVDEENKTIRVSDTGVGMTADEIVEGLGVIARSGARTFLEALGDTGASTISTDIIGQFGVGFYSVFMVAERVEVTSRSFRPDAEAVTWVSTGEEGYDLYAADKTTRGTDILITLREDAHEFASVWRLRDIIKRHSDYINFPIYVVQAGEAQADEEAEPLTPVNQQTALWRQASDIGDEEYDKFYSMLTLDLEQPIVRIHMRSDAPLQFYALLFVPRSSERSILSPRKEPGLKLYARKVLIQEYTTDLLPEYLLFVHGVVDSEDLPLNISRETIQSSPVVNKLRQVLTRRVLSELSTMAEQDAEQYAAFWSAYSVFIKQGAITEFGDRERLLPLLRFYSSKSEDRLISLDNYVANFVKGQNTIYYVVADDVASASRSLHLDPFRARDIEVLYLIETIDGFLVPALQEYQGHAFVGADAADLDLDGVGTRPATEDTAEALPEADIESLVSTIKQVLGDRVESVRVSKVLSSGSAARLVAPKGTPDRHQQRLYQMLEREFEAPVRILEINPKHPLIQNLSARLVGEQQDDLLTWGIHVLYENAMLADGIHPDPAEMAGDIQALLEIATRPDWEYGEGET